MTPDSSSHPLIDFSLHSAPALSYPVGRSRFQGALVGLVGLASAVTGLLWQFLAAPSGWRQALFAAILLGVFTFAVHAWRHTSPGYLSWDGQAWRWTGSGRSGAGTLVVHLDFQLFMILSLRLDSGARIWLWPERQSEAPLWHALRRAVFSHARAARASGATHAIRLGAQLKS